MNNRYRFLFSKGIIYLFNIVLPNRDEVIQQCFKSGLSYNEKLSVLSAQHNVSLSIHQLKRILKKLDLSRRTLKSSIDGVIAFVINELQSSSKCLGYRAMHQKLMINGFIIDHESVRLILKELDPLVVEQRARHRLTRHSYISTGPKHTWHIDGYNKLKTFGFAIHGAIDCYSRKILWLFVGSSNNDPKAIAYYFVNCIVNLQLVPRLIRGDKGLENVVVAGIQRYFGKDGEDHMAGINSFKFGPSTRN